MEIKRDRYLKKIISFMWDGQVKVITGIRRCGKSFLLRNLFKSYLLGEGVTEDHILSFELDLTRDIRYRNPLELSAHIREIVEHSADQYYLFVDEIQMSDEVPNPYNPDGKKVTFYDALNDLKSLSNLDIYVTGSNSKMLSSDILTEFRGRSDEIRVHPLSFAEYYSAVGGDKQDAFEDYAFYGGMPLIQRFLLDIYRRKNRGAKIICCAPTGRAARRMEQSTGFPATTIHKALGLLAGEDGDYCEPEMLDADLIVVDEVSMMDIYLANHLFRSVPHGSQLVLIGDADQLPSVGPGAVLSEIIACGAVPVVRLDRIFRQSYGSRIAANAKLIRHGNLSLEYGEDFQFYDSCDMSASAQQIETLYLQETARYGVDNVALLTPYRQKTETGVNALNERLREKLNPQDGKKPEVAYRKRIYRLGDKVMQIKNCEDISNGDIGYITSVTRDDTDSVLTVDFGDGRIAEYDGSDLEMLDLAYASTIHKSQGSEYKSVIINLQCAHAVMLVRPLVYTAITRAKERVLIVGERRALCIAIKRTDTEQRGTMLSARIKELISNVKGDHYNGNLAQ